MKLHVSNDIQINVEEMTDPLKKKLLEILTIENPDYLKSMKYGKGRMAIQEKIKLYKFKGRLMHVPRGLVNFVIGYLKQTKISYELLDQRLLLPKVEFRSSINLRDYQRKAVDTMLSVTQGFLVSPCGSGKTIMMIEMMTRIKQPTLFVVHQRELMDQIINTVVALTDVSREEIGIIGTGKRSIGKRMTVATIQTLNRMDIEEINDKFGAIFIDEAHHLAARSFYNIISKFRSRYRFAVSATPERADGLTQMVYACTGGIVHEIEQGSVPTIIPSLKVMRTSFSCKYNDYSEIIKALVNNKERNQLILDQIKLDAPSNFCLVLSDRVDHLKTLKTMIDEALPELRVEILTGALPKTKRIGLMEEAKNRKIDILLATQLAREGLDIPHLNRLFLTYPKKSPTSVQQEVGRVMRPTEGKNDAIVYDFVDQNGILESQFRKRCTVYKQIGMRK